MRDINNINDNYSLSLELYNALQKMNPADLERIGTQNRKTISVALKNFTSDRKESISLVDLRTAIDSLRAKELPTIGIFKKIAIEIANLFHTSVSPVGILEQKEKIRLQLSPDQTKLDSISPDQTKLDSISIELTGLNQTLFELNEKQNALDKEKLIYQGLSRVLRFVQNADGFTQVLETIQKRIRTKTEKNIEERHIIKGEHIDKNRLLRYIQGTNQKIQAEQEKNSINMQSLAEKIQALDSEKNHIEETVKFIVSKDV